MQSFQGACFEFENSISLDIAMDWVGNMVHLIVYEKGILCRESGAHLENLAHQDIRHEMQAGIPFGFEHTINSI